MALKRVVNVSHIFKNIHIYIFNINTYKNLVRAQINYIKATDYGNNNPWVTTMVVNGMFKDDLVNTIKQIGKVKSKILNDIGISTLGDLHKYQDTLGNLTPKQISVVRQAIDNSISYIDEDRPIIKINHLDHDNPYVSKYGTDWEKYIKKCQTLKDAVFVKELIDHKYEKSSDIMKGTPYQDNFYY